MLVQRSSITAGGGLEFRPPGTAAWFVYELEDKNFCQALFVEPKLLPIAN